MLLGKVWKPKEQPKSEAKAFDDDISETEWDAALKEATEEELVDLAGELLCLHVKPSFIFFLSSIL